jgi:hypothetical protein
VSSEPHAIHIEKREASTIRTAASRLGGQSRIGPSGVDVQSNSSIRARMSSPAAAGEVCDAESLTPPD